MTPQPGEDHEPTPGRRGWREHLEPGLYRSHRVRCPRSTDHRTGRRCDCPFSIVVPGVQVGTTRQVSHPGPIAEARAERRRLLSGGRSHLERDAQPVPSRTLRDLATRYLTTRQRVLAPNTLTNIATDYRLRIDPVLGAHDVGEITRERVEIFVAELAARASSRRMIAGAVASLRAILSAGVEWDRISSNTALRLRLPAPEHHER